MFHRRRRGEALTEAELGRIERLLEYLDLAAEPADLDVSGFGLHRVSDKRNAAWALKVSANYRITFRFEGADVYDVDLVGYDRK